MKLFKKIAKSIQRNRAGLKDPNKPIGSFIFLGQTGVGKTQLAKSYCSKELFDSRRRFSRIDMSEYMEKFNFKISWSASRIRWIRRRWTIN